MGVLSKADKKELKALKAKKAAGSLEGGDKSRLKELKALLKSLKAAKNASDASGSAEERKSNDGDDDADKKKKKKRKRDAPESSTSSTSSTASASSASPASAKKVAPGDTAADAAYRESHGIAAGIAAGDTDARPLPPCLRSFAATPFDARIKAALTGAGYADPTPIQAQGWSVALSGDDMIAVAKTGSGKTVAFLLPVFHGLLAARAASASPSHGSAAAGPGALVIAPTRELASQIHVECERFGACLGLRSVCLYGGTNVAEQKALLRRGASMPDVVVGTPGRLVDLMEQKALVLSPQCAYVVLDEADRMLDMGFEPQIKAIFDALPSERQTLMFSATFDKGMRKLAGKYLRDSDKVATLFVESGENAELKANMSVSQRIIKVTDDEKDAKLMEVLNGLEANCRVICFANTKRRVDYLAKNLWTQGYVKKKRGVKPSYLHPVYTRYTPLLPYVHLCTPRCTPDIHQIHTIYTSNTPLNTPYTPYIHPIYTPLLLSGGVTRRCTETYRRRTGSTRSRRSRRGRSRCCARRTWRRGGWTLRA